MTPDQQIQAIRNALASDFWCDKFGKANVTAIAALLTRLDAAEADAARYVLKGYWFSREVRFTSLHEAEIYFDDQERAELLVPLFAARAQEGL
jgi:hypothetical protein